MTLFPYCLDVNRCLGVFFLNCTPNYARNHFNFTENFCYQSILLACAHNFAHTFKFKPKNTILPLKRKNITNCQHQINRQQVMNEPENPSSALPAPFNPREAARSLARPSTSMGRKLSFYDQCAVFYALYNRISPNVVAKAFDISGTAVSQIGGCLKRDPRPYATELTREKTKMPNGEIRYGEFVEKRVLRDMNRNRSPNRIARYRRVADEFERLGEEEFAARYFPERIAIRLTEAKYAIEMALPAPDGKTIWVDLPDRRVQVGWRDEPNPPGPAGWYIFGEHVDIGSRYATTGEQWPFKTQQRAREAVWLLNGLEPPK